MVTFAVGYKDKVCILAESDLTWDTAVLYTLQVERAFRNFSFLPRLSMNEPLPIFLPAPQLCDDQYRIGPIGHRNAQVLIDCRNYYKHTSTSPKPSCSGKMVQDRTLIAQEILAMSDRTHQ